MKKKDDNKYAFPESDQIPSPQLIFYEDQIRQNVAWMTEAAKGGCNLWPHIKTHKSADVVRIMQSYGINRFKCSTIAEAEMVASLGAEAVVLAYTLIGPNIGRFLSLAEKYDGTVFYALADSKVGLCQIEDAVDAKDVEPVNVLVDLNLGQNRTGTMPEEALPLCQYIDQSDSLIWSGFHCYDGHVGKSEFDLRMAIVKEEHQRLEVLFASLHAAGILTGLVIYGGSTTFTCHAALTNRYFSPGTCVIHDYGYKLRFDDLRCEPAAAIMTRVISHPTDRLFTLDVGCKAIAADLATDVRGSIVGLEDDAESVFQNEEHWVWRVKNEAQVLPAIGDILYVIPGHVCPSVVLYSEAAVVSRGKLKTFWPITARDRKLTI